MFDIYKPEIIKDKMLNEYEVYTYQFSIRGNKHEVSNQIEKQNYSKHINSICNIYIRDLKQERVNEIVANDGIVINEIKYLIKNVGHYRNCIVLECEEYEFEI